MSMKSDMIPGLKSYGVRDERDPICKDKGRYEAQNRGDAPRDTRKRQTEDGASESVHSWSPDVFEFYYGRFIGNSFYARWDGEKVILEQSDGGNFSSEARKIAPSEYQWRIFFETISDIGCSGWQPEYLSPHGCCGVTYWHIRIKYRGLTVCSGGEDAFPETPGPSPSEGFNAFLAAFRLLIAPGPDMQ